MSSLWQLGDESHVVPKHGYATQGGDSDETLTNPDYIHKCDIWSRYETSSISLHDRDTGEAAKRPD